MKDFIVCSPLSFALILTFMWSFVECRPTREDSENNVEAAELEQLLERTMQEIRHIRHKAHVQHRFSDENNHQEPRHVVQHRHRRHKKKRRSLADDKADISNTNKVMLRRARSKHLMLTKPFWPWP
ncbi:hypothetical protein DdX_07009 [Ditylenchus destructor]|uniref:Uncharacterized protein n=1 Tax=Ditylenchus destructor TaxID=166010 RepID=A0AAD4R8H0_9BILA|nr:hypothetical protein DdX_07009 [Ditylenchus destructor]